MAMHTVRIIKGGRTLLRKQVSEGLGRDAVVIPAQADVTYLFSAPLNNAGPAKISVKRVGNNSQPSAEKLASLQARFDALFTQSTDYYTLDDLLLRLHRRKSELLLVLKRPDIPLHTNGSETDIRDYVKKRKVSGGTRSDLGRQCRDTFASLKKTCRKLGVPFWLYLLDRVSLTNAIPPLPTLIRNAAIAGALP